MENKDFTVIYDDEDVIGKVKDIKKCFINELAKILEDREIDIEEQINQINLIQDLLEELSDENNNTIIKVSFNPMGAFYYSYVNWEVKDEN